MPEIDDSVKLTHDLLQEYSSARQNWAKQAIEDNEFRNGKQWKDDHIKVLRARNQEPIVVNTVYPAVEQAKALLTSNRPRFQCTGRDDSDNNTARVFSDLLSWVWDQNDGNSILKQVIDDYYVKGIGALMAYADPQADFGKGDIRLASIDPLDLYIDPASRDPYIKDAAHVIIARKMMQSELIKTFPAYSEIIMEATETSYIDKPGASRGQLWHEEVIPHDKAAVRSADDDKQLEVMERYTKVKIPYKRSYDPFNDEEKIMDEQQYNDYLARKAWVVIRKDSEPEFITNPKQVASLEALYKETGGVFHEFQDPMSGEIIPIKGKENKESVPGSTTELIPTSISDLVIDKMIQVVYIILDRIECCVSIGDQMLYKKIKPIEEYPIITFMNGHNRNPFPLSDVRLVKGLQEYINKIRSLIVAHASSSTNVKLLIPRGSMNKKQLEEEWGRAGTAVIEFDPELGQPIVAGPVPLPNELYKNEADAKADIEQILGIYSSMQGDPKSSPSTYKGTIAIDEFGQRRIRSKKDDIESALNVAGKVIIELMQSMYTDQKVIRLLQPNTGPKEIEVNKREFDPITGSFMGKTNDITVGKYDVQVVSGSTLPSNRWARFEYYKELFSLGVIDQVELLKQTDVADYEGVLRRSGIAAKQAQQVQQLQEELKRTKGDLQTAQRESTHDRKRLEVKEFEVKLAKAEAKAEMAAQLFSHRAGDELKKIKEEAKAIEPKPPKNKVIGL